MAGRRGGNEPLFGVDGILARGLRFEGVPGWDALEKLPLFDQSGPLPVDKRSVRRDDLSGGEFPDLEWQDDVSGDGVLGWCYALGIFWDVIVDDPSISPARKATLQADALHVATKLMEVAPEYGVDLLIRDPDGSWRSAGAGEVAVFVDGQPQSLSVLP